MKIERVPMLGLVLAVTLAHASVAAATSYKGRIHTRIRIAGRRVPLLKSSREIRLDFASAGNGKTRLTGSFLDGKGRPGSRVADVTHNDEDYSHEFRFADGVLRARPGEPVPRGTCCRDLLVAGTIRPKGRVLGAIVSVQFEGALQPIIDTRGSQR